MRSGVQLRRKSNGPVELRPIEDDALNELRQHGCQLRDRRSANDHLSRRDAHAARRLGGVAGRSGRRTRAAGSRQARTIELRRSEIRTELAILARHDQRVHRQLPRFLMNDETKAIGEKRAQHEEQRQWRTGWAPGRKRLLGFRDDVEALRADPVGAADQPHVLRVVRHANQLAHRNVGRCEAIVAGDLHADAQLARLIRLDGDHLERRRGWLRRRRLLAIHGREDGKGQRRAQKH